MKPVSRPAPRGGAVVHGHRGAAAAGSPQAADTAIRVLSAGGNAMDAAIAASAVQCVTEFPWCGVGGDMFLLVDRDDEGVLALNGSGAAPLRPATSVPGLAQIPRFGPLSVAVPGLPAAWQTALARFGSMPLVSLLEPAIALAHDGFPLTDRLAEALAQLRQSPLDEHPGLAALLAGNGATAGARFRQPDLAHTLESLGRHGAAWFYHGEFATRLEAHMRARGGLLDRADLSAHRTGWSRPLSATYRGYEIFQNPPVSLGAVMLAELRLLERFDVGDLPPGSPELIDLMVRCKMAAFADTMPLLAQPNPADVELLSEERLARSGERLRQPPVLTSPLPEGTDTTCLAVTDAAGMTVTLIHSLFNSFGSRELVAGTGVVLNDRLAALRVDDGPGLPLRAGARPLHTLNSYLVKRGGRVVVAGATPGGRGQVQTNFQVLVNLIDHGMDPLAAVAQPRWVHGTPRSSVDDGVLHVEPGLDARCQHRLGAEFGYQVRPAGPDSPIDDLFGSATIVGRTPCTGMYAVADGRRGAAANSW